MRNSLTLATTGEIWNNPDNKAVWKFLTDDICKCDDVRDEIEKLDKDTRIQAQKAARAEYVQWITTQCEITPDIDEFDIRDMFVVRYWNRVAELAGI